MWDRSMSSPTGQNSDICIDRTGSYIATFSLVRLVQVSRAKKNFA
jgi:hypothetical protein